MSVFALKKTLRHYGDLFCIRNVIFAGIRWHVYCCN